MENLDPDQQSKSGRLDIRNKIQAKNLSLRNKLPIQKRNKQSSMGELDDSVNNFKANKNNAASENSASTSSLVSSNDVSLTENNDSLCDFRSPIKNDEMNESMADFKIKPTVLKSNKRMARKDSKSVMKKKRSNRETPSILNQPSIESSFFKPQTTVKTAFVCALCLKSYKDATAQHSHMKICAAKNKISTDRLLDAVELQKKQADERKALGLLDAPPIQPKKTISRKFISEKDPQLQLALALSMSLHEAQVTEEFEDAHLLAGEPCLPINSEMTEERRKTLQNFGFTTNKPVTASTSGRSRKKRPTGPTALQNRTKEERDRLLTVRIAEVLMGDEAITQALLKNVEKVIKSEENIILKSRLLRSYHCVKDRLWDKTQQCLKGQSPYSCNLLETSPCKVKPETEMNEPEQGTSKLETPVQSANNAPDVVAGSSKPAIDVESAPEISTINNKKRTAVKNKTDVDSVMNLSKDWRGMLGASYMSDVLVIAKGDIKIHAHQVVFWARCNDILKDMSRDDSDRSWEIQQRILWPETDAISANAFLEYVYCGVIEIYICVFDHPDMLAGVKVLARNYRLKKLFAYLRDKSNEIESAKVETSKGKIDSAPNTSDDSSSEFSDEESSLSSVETDINSVSTVCDESTSNKPVIDKRCSNSDNVERKNLKSMNVQEKNNISDNLVVDCFSSSDDSCAIRIPKILSSTKTNDEKLSGREMRERISTNVPTAFSNKTDIQSIRECSSSPNKKNYHVDHENNTNIKLINKTLEEERCTSPDIFDDSTTSNSAYIYTVPKESRCDPDHDRNCSDVDIEVVSPSSRSVQNEMKSPDSDEKFDKMADISPENNCRKSDRPFVSTRRKGRSFKPPSADVGNLNLESTNLYREKQTSGTLMKQKGDITLAIEKIQRLNAKTASESDSDCESVQTFPIKKHKNPFRINITNTSSMIEDIGEDDLHSESNNKIPSKRRNKLSIFEKKIELEAAKNPARFNLATTKPVSDVYSKKSTSTDSSKSRTSSGESQNLKFDQQQNTVEIEDEIEPSQRASLKPDDTVDEIFDLTQESSRESKLDSEDADSCNSNIEDKDLSMFTRYKRKHSHNSIDKYRAALKKISSRSSVTSIKDTDETSSSNDSLISNDELWDADSKIKRNNLSSKNEDRHSNQSTSNVHRELSSISLKGKKQISNSPESLSSTESDDRERGAVKLDDVELSDLEIDLSDFSKSSNLLSNSRVDGKSQEASTSKRKSGNGIFDNKREIDSLSDIKLDDTEFTIMKNDCGIRNTNISDQETDTECFIESISSSKEPKIVDKIERQSAVDEEKTSDIYNEETDVEETEAAHYQPRDSQSKMKLDIKPDDAFKETSGSQSCGKDRCKISSPGCEMSGIFSPPAMSFDFLTDVTNKVENPHQQCKTSSQILFNSRMHLDDCNSPATSPAVASKPRDDLNDINLFNALSDSEFDDIEFTVNKDSSKSAELDTGEKSIDEKLDEKYYILDSDSSNSGSFRIHKAKSNTSISLGNSSKAIEKRSLQSRRESITPQKSSRSSLRTLNVKSISENITKTKSKSGIYSMNDSFDCELARVKTPPIQEPNTSSYNDQTTPQQAPPSENVTPLANYSAMKSPELTKALKNYGIKPLKRHRAKQLLRHIYNELHPLVPAGDKNVVSHSDESSSEDERPPPKRLYRSNSFEAINIRKNSDNIESDCETPVSDIRIVSDASNDDGDLENNELYTLSQSGNADGFEKAFRNLLKVDRRLHNKILAYEPLILEELHATLKAQGVKCNLNTLKDFLDEQCITFREVANAKKSRQKGKANPKKNQGTQ